MERILQRRQPSPHPHRLVHWQFSTIIRYSIRYELCHDLPHSNRWFGESFPPVLGLNILALGGAITGLFLVDIIGRRTLALTTFVLIFIIDLVIGSLGFVDATHSPAASRTIAAFCLMFAFLFAAGFGPLTYIVSSEVPTARLRNKTSAFTFLTLALFSLAVV